MRAFRVCVVVGLLCAAVASKPTLADEYQQTIYLARVPGFVLFVIGDGEKPCDFTRAKLLNDAKFVLNTASVEFAEVGTPANTNKGWPYLSIFVQSLKTSNGCVWSLNMSVRAIQSGAMVLGEPYGGTVEIWSASNFGTSPGNGLTAYVSETIQDELKELVNDMHASRKNLTP
jgi:hypothetical protein